MVVFFLLNPIAKNKDSKAYTYYKYVASWTYFENKKPFEIKIMLELRPLNINSKSHGVFERDRRSNRF